MRVARYFLNENSRTTQEHFKNIPIRFKTISIIENTITIDLNVFLKSLTSLKPKTNFMKSKYQQEQSFGSLSIIK